MKKITKAEAVSLARAFKTKTGEAYEVGEGVWGGWFFGRVDIGVRVHWKYPSNEPRDLDGAEMAAIEVMRKIGFVHAPSLDDMIDAILKWSQAEDSKELKARRLIGEMA